MAYRLEVEKLGPPDLQLQTSPPSATIEIKGINHSGQGAVKGQQDRRRSSD